MSLALEAHSERESKRHALATSPRSTLPGEFAAWPQPRSIGARLRSSWLPVGLAVSALAFTGCGRTVESVQPTPPQEAGSGPRPSADGECDLAAPFSGLTTVFDLTTQAGFEEGRVGQLVSLSSNETSLYYDLSVPSSGRAVICVSRRRSRAEPFGAPAKVQFLGESDAGYGARNPAVSGDERLIILESSGLETRVGAIYWAVRASLNDSFSAVVRPPGFEDEDPSYPQDFPILFPDGKRLNYGTNSSLHFQRVERELVAGRWTPFVEVGGGAAPATADGLELIRGRDFRYRRLQIGGRFVQVPDNGGAEAIQASWLSPNGCRIYGPSRETFGRQVLMASRPKL